MKRISIVLATILLASLSSASFAASKSERKPAKPKEKLDSIHERIESLKKELNTTKEAHADVADAFRGVAPAAVGILIRREPLKSRGDQRGTRNAECGMKNG